MAVIAGFSNALVLAIINSAAQQPAAGMNGPAPSPLLFSAFIVTILLYITAQRFILTVTNAEVERVIGKLRIRIVDKIRKSDLLPLEALGKAQIFSIITRDTQTLSESASPAVIAIQSAILILFTAAYIALLSVVAFLVAAFMIGVGILVHFHRMGPILKDLQESTARENDFVSSLTQLLEGFKEVKINSTRSEDLHTQLEQITASVVALKTRTGRLFADHYIFSQTIFYLTLAAIVFVLPRFPGVAISGVEMRVTAALLFIIGPLSSLVGTIPTFSRTNVAVGNITRLEAQLMQLQRSAADNGEEDVEPPKDFDEIRLSGVRFVYRDPQGEPSFQVGPLTLTIHKGELLFVVGGNGSGKSTFFKLLTALYYPDAGTIQLDGKDIAEIGYGRYRNLFSAIFSDYFLFDRLVGVGQVQEGTVQTMLKQMGLADKTAFVNGRFVNQGLSTGQRKRLALIVSLLEDRPILIFDEWAADQDPSFRHHFYTEILPKLKAEKKTIIAATHDDRYFGVADRVVKMENGILTEIHV
jgi:putative ATP-binding cassette transporter